MLDKSYTVCDRNISITIKWSVGAKQQSSRQDTFWKFCDRYQRSHGDNLVRNSWTFAGMQEFRGITAFQYTSCLKKDFYESFFKKL